MHPIDEDTIEYSPLNPASNHGSSLLTKQYHPALDLKPKQSTMYTHHRYFKIEHDFDMVYQRIIFAENILDPIQKEIKIHFRLKNIELDINEIIRLIQDLELKKKFNDAGVYEFVAAVLAKEKGEFVKCNTK